MKNKPFAVALALVVALTATRVASAAYFYEEHFNTDTTNVTNTYPQYVLNITGTAAVTNQQLRLVNAGTGSGILATTQSFGSAISDIHVELKLEGASPGNGDIGLVLGSNPAAFLTSGDNSIELFAGYTGGQIRIEGTPGSVPLTSIGFVPAQGIMHAFDIHTAGTGLFTLKLTEGTAANSFVAGANSFSVNWTNPGLTNGYKIGFFVGSGPLGATATFDNLIVVPEPAVCALLSTALGLLWFKARKR